MRADAALIGEYLMQYIGDEIERRGQSGVPGETTVKFVWRDGGLVEAHVDGHLKLTADVLRKQAAS